MQRFQDSWRTLLDEEGYRGVRLERVLIEPSRRRMVARFTMDELPAPGVEQGLRRALLKRFPQCAVQIRIACPSLAERFLASPGDYAEYVTTLLLDRSPGAAPFMRAAEWSVEDGRLILRTRGAAGASYLTERGCTQALATILKDLFKMDMPVMAQALELPEYDDIEAREEEKALLRRIVEERERAAKNEKDQRLTQERVFYGAKISGTPSPIGELTEDSGVVVLEGRSLSVETRLLKGETRLLVSLGVTDYSGSILVKAFMEPADEKKTAQLAAGTGVRVKGECRYDNFAKEIAIVARDITIVPLKARTDEEELKRVELHLHTQMSALDGVSSPSALMQRTA